MIIYQGFKYKLLPTNEQKQQLLQHSGNTRFLWNHVLKINQDFYSKTGKFKFYHELSKSLLEFKEEYPFLKESFSQSLQTVLKQFDRALKQSFKKENKFPIFKKKALLNDSFTCPQRWKLKRGFVFIPKIGNIRWKKHRNLKGKPKSITISQDGSEWYCSVLCVYEIPNKEKKINHVIGCDVGLKEFATLSDGTVINNPKHIKNYENKLAKAQKRLSHKQKESKNRLKQQLKVRKIQHKIKNIRKDFLHKTSNLIVKNYDGISVENLNIRGMIKNRCLAKSIVDASWSEFNRQLEYKCMWNFKHYIKIGRFEPTSKTCSYCGHIQEMPLNKRMFVCFNCGISLNRDLNASINIKNIGFNTGGQPEIYACGEKLKRFSLKQEKECLENYAEVIGNIV